MCPERFVDQLNSPLELTDYRDEGCELSGSCLGCPFTGCVHDSPAGERSWRKKQRAMNVCHLFTEGKQVKELALMFGVSERTVRRDLKEKFVPISIRDAPHDFGNRGEELNSKPEMPISDVMRHPEEVMSRDKF